MEIKLYLVFKTLQLRRKKEPEQHHERREKEQDKRARKLIWLAQLSYYI